MKMSMGGQAVIGGVMIRSPKHVCIAVRKPSGKIVVRCRRFVPISEKYPFFKLPILRGCVSLVETLTIGLDALEYSANQATEEEKMSKAELIASLAIAFAFVAVFFIGLPFFLATLLHLAGFWFNLIDGIIRMMLFVAYLVVLSFFPDVQELFQYHGAEHKAVHAYEHGKKLSVKNLKPFPTMHPRCGTSFIIIVLVISILVFSLVTSKLWYVQLASRIILIPIVAGLSYELLKLSAKFEKNIIFRIVAMPGILFQYITTKQPNSKQMEVAIAAVEGLVKRG